ncbi:hypothetical protein VP01_626g4 [Puccinia sorghi]|uniref:Uncharacterized protein n=1 Tax=Puccinia sorghi TaxID=27349 RepID=A0A0L6UGG3_9BASI|nr:hypothetical protein VP01_626g4 [Puccinia sorghi]
MIAFLISEILQSHISTKFHSHVYLSNSVAIMNLWWISTMKPGLLKFQASNSRGLRKGAVRWESLTGSGLSAVQAEKVVVWKMNKKDIMNKIINKQSMRQKRNSRVRPGSPAPAHPENSDQTHLIHYNRVQNHDHVFQRQPPKYFTPTPHRLQPSIPAIPTAVPTQQTTTTPGDNNFHRSSVSESKSPPQHSPRWLVKRRTELEPDRKPEPTAGPAMTPPPLVAPTNRIARTASNHTNPSDSFPNNFRLFSSFYFQQSHGTEKHTMTKRFKKKPNHFLTFHLTLLQQFLLIYIRIFRDANRAGRPTLSEYLKCWPDPADPNHKLGWTWATHWAPIGQPPACPWWYVPGRQPLFTIPLSPNHDSWCLVPTKLTLTSILGQLRLKMTAKKSKLKPLSLRLQYLPSAL